LEEEGGRDELRDVLPLEVGGEGEEYELRRVRVGSGGAPSSCVWRTTLMLFFTFVHRLSLLLFGIGGSSHSILIADKEQVVGGRVGRKCAKVERERERDERLSQKRAKSKTQRTKGSLEKIWLGGRARVFIALVQSRKKRENRRVLGS
jgi:hypothetical protein